MKFFLFFITIFFSITFFSCNTLSKNFELPKKIDYLTSTTDIQEPFFYDFIAKDFYKNRDYGRAIEVYQMMIDKFSKLEYQEAFKKQVTWAEYEIAFCYFKLKDYSEAEERFQNLSQGDNDLVVVSLSEIMLKRIQQRLSDKKVSFTSVPIASP